jgi:hypothetical protein
MANLHLDCRRATPRALIVSYRFGSPGRLDKFVILSVSDDSDASKV